MADSIFVNHVSLIRNFQLSKPTAFVREKNI